MVHNIVHSLSQKFGQLCLRDLPGLNQRGPSRKAKYSLMTDSELSSASERWKVPRLGEWNSIWNHVPTSGWSPMVCPGWQRAFCIMIRRVVVCSKVKVLRTGALGKPSVNSAIKLHAADAKPGDLPMSRLKRGLYCVEDRTHLGWKLRGWLVGRSESLIKPGDSSFFAKYLLG